VSKEGRTVAKSDIIQQTMKNMQLLYHDFATMAQIIEQYMRNNGLEAFGGANGTWGNSTAYYKPRGWLCRSFARAYARGPLVRKCVGFCMHFGAYRQEDVELLSALRVRLPSISVSALSLEADFNRTQAYLYRTLFRAGWKDVRDVRSEHNTVIRSTVLRERNRIGASAATYFLDLLLLNSKDAIHRLVAEPMVRMYGGEEQFVAEKGLPEIQVVRGEGPPAGAEAKELGA
jgi:hypothetical protein